MSRYLKFRFKLNTHKIVKASPFPRFALCVIIMVIPLMLCFPSFLIISYHLPWCFHMFLLVFLQFPQVLLLFPFSVSHVSYFTFWATIIPENMIVIVKIIQIPIFFFDILLPGNKVDLKTLHFYIGFLWALQN